MLYEMSMSNDKNIVLFLTKNFVVIYSETLYL